MHFYSPHGLLSQLSFLCIRSSLQHLQPFKGLTKIGCWSKLSTSSPLDTPHHFREVEVFQSPTRHYYYLPSGFSVWMEFQHQVLNYAVMTEISLYGWIPLAHKLLNPAPHLAKNRIESCTSCLSGAFYAPSPTWDWSTVSLSCRGVSTKESRSAVR